MNKKDADGRVLFFALLGVLLIRLLAWGPGAELTAHASRLNQTIPTPTPSGQAVTPPTEPSRTPRPTEPPPEPSVTPSPSASSSPSASPTSTVAGTLLATANPATSTPSLPTSTEAPSPTFEPPTSTPLPSATKPAPSPSASATPMVPLVGTTAPALPSPSPRWTVVPATPTAAGGGETRSSLSYLWLVLGLVLIGGGAGVLLWRRRSV